MRPRVRLTRERGLFLFSATLLSAIIVFAPVPAQWVPPLALFGFGSVALLAHDLSERC